MVQPAPGHERPALARGIAASSSAFRSRRRDSANLPLAAQSSVGHIGGSRRRGRVAEGGGLLNRYRVVKPYRGFESLRLRQSIFSATYEVFSALKPFRGWRN